MSTCQLLAELQLKTSSPHDGIGASIAKRDWELKKQVAWSGQGPAFK